ncbi:MAG: Type 1 glutamine amidotransferase-like domain-containing protein [Clostridia bacterium]|nr:Type 1 glutamine amidotransferase-like domain-containing protein [Clostridia bacterium]
MAKLILSSRDFQNEVTAACIRRNLPKPIEECRVLFFPNEKADEERLRGNKYRNRLARFGFSRDNVTVFNYYAPPAVDPTAVDAVYIGGGNTFGTLRRIREANAEPLIMDCLAAGAVYVGGSAGAHIASADITHVQRYDTDTFGVTDFSALHLLDAILICHYGEPRRAHYEQLLRQSPYRVLTLTDDECIVLP